MHWKDDVFADITAKINQLGLSDCHVCGSETGLHADKRPVVLNIGGPGKPKPDGTKDPEENIFFMIRVECITCGYSQMFNSERFITGDTPALAPG
jgi:hypothetical protein